MHNAFSSLVFPSALTRGLWSTFYFPSTVPFTFRDESDGKYKNMKINKATSYSYKNAYKIIMVRWWFW